MSENMADGTTETERTVTIQGTVFALDEIVEAHLSRGLTGGVLDLRTADGEEHTFHLWIRDSAADHAAYVTLTYDSGCCTETRPRGWGGSGG
ncbi:hypothetical protein V2W30_03070 [Streptomyces sp. Q6]|uniref:Uncharacterized protein n=1 Tax=Streptomyces citrinus TaxID=3118173 RepID=A0ACD5A5P7_9ACTN